MDMVIFLLILENMTAYLRANGTTRIEKSEKKVVTRILELAHKAESNRLAGEYHMKMKCVT
jgi:hypothetical protein